MFNDSRELAYLYVYILVRDHGWKQARIFADLCKLVGFVCCKHCQSQAACSCRTLSIWSAHDPWSRTCLLQACALQRAKRGTKLTCCTKNAARPHAYPASGCVDLLRDRGYCGSCTNFCGKGQKCVAGKCVRPPPPPPPGTVPEDPSCAAILCPSPSICCAGTCCSINSTCCSGACTDLQTDSANCGLCGRKCQYPPGMVGIPRFCSEGVCVNG